MAFTVHRKQSMGRNLLRLLISQNDRAIRQLESFEEDPENTVHEARISFKRIRTILRLLRKELKRRKFQKLNRAYRDLGLQLSAQRDACVKQQALNSLESSDDVHGYIPTKADKEAVSVVLNALQGLRKQLLSQNLKNKKFSAIRGSCRSIYRLGRSAMLRAASSGEDEEFHEWRKNAKHLYHFIGIIQPVWPVIFTPLRKELYVLTQLLGDDHDLSILKLDALSVNDKSLAENISRQQKDMRAEAISLGEKIYAEKSSCFISRIERYWRLYRRSPQ